MPLVTYRFPGGKEMKVGHLYPSRLVVVQLSCEQLLQWTVCDGFHSSEKEEYTERSGQLSLCQAVLRTLVTAFLQGIMLLQRRGWGNLFVLWGLEESHYAQRFLSFGERHERMEMLALWSGGELKGSRQCPGAWVIWITYLPAVLVGSETLEIPYFSLLPAGSPQHGLFGPVKLCGGGIWPQKCCWEFCCGRVDLFSGTVPWTAYACT